jgi:hypothetical protein
MNKAILEQEINANIFSSKDFVSDLVASIDYEQLVKRGEAKYSKEEQARIKNAHVLILGLGGTGSYTLEAIARAGVGNVVGVDFDTVDPENLYRQEIGRVEYLGMKKAEASAREVAQYAPKTNFLSIDTKVDDILLENINLPTFDIVLVALDNQEARAKSHRFAMEKGIPSIDIRVSPPDRVYVTTYLPDGISYSENLNLPGDLSNAHKERARVCAEEFGAKSEWAENYINEKTGWSIPGLATLMSSQLMARECLNYIVNGKSHVSAPKMYCFEGIELSIKNPPQEGWDYKRL